MIRYAYKGKTFGDLKELKKLKTPSFSLFNKVIKSPCFKTQNLIIREWSSILLHLLKFYGFDSVMSKSDNLKVTKSPTGMYFFMKIIILNTLIVSDLIRWTRRFKFLGLIFVFLNH